MTLDYKAIDVDNHYYETLDSCTRHLPKEFKRRGVQMVQDGKRTWAVMGEKVNHFIPNPTFDPIIEPGCLDLLFRGEIPEGVDPASLMKVDRLGRASRVPEPRCPSEDPGHAEPRDGVHAAHVRVRRRGGAQARRRGDHGHGARVQPLARRGLGFRPSRPPDHLCTDHLAGRPGQGRRRGRVRIRQGRQDGAGAAGAGAGSGQAPFVGRSAARPGVGTAGRGRGAGWLPPVGQWLPRDRGAVGRQGDVRGVRQEGPARSGAARRPRHPRHDGLDDRAPGVHPPSRS